MKLLCTVFLLIIAVNSPAQSRRVALLDMTARNLEPTDGNLFSANHLLVIAGIDFFNTTNVNVAVQSGMIVCSSNIENFSFSQTERDTLTAFVNRGGVLAVCSLKDSLLFSLFGVNDYQYSTNHYEIRCTDHGKQTTENIATYSGGWRNRLW